MHNYYFAYGSNMIVEKMREMCPSAEIVGKAKLPNYKVVERKYADIDKEEGSSVDGLLWDIKDMKDYINLDEYEGYPDLYKKYSTEVECNNQSYEAVVYEMTDRTKIELANVKYSAEYRNACKQSALKIGIPSFF